MTRPGLASEMWDGYVRHSHDERAGITNAVLGRFGLAASATSVAEEFVRSLCAYPEDHRRASRLHRGSPAARWAAS